MGATVALDSERQDRMTYEEVGQRAGLNERTLALYVSYMKSRWPNDEDVKCRVGYADEWAYRFKVGIARTCSDAEGKRVLDALEKGRLP